DAGKCSLHSDSGGATYAWMMLPRSNPPAELLDEPVIEWVDLLAEAGVVMITTSNARVVARPSGTEPKLKAYLEIREEPGEDLEEARERARASLAALRAEVAGLLGVPH